MSISQSTYAWPEPFRTAAAAAGMLCCMLFLKILLWPGIPAPVEPMAAFLTEALTSALNSSYGNTHRSNSSGSRASWTQLPVRQTQLTNVGLHTLGPGIMDSLFCKADVAGECWPSHTWPSAPLLPGCMLRADCAPHDRGMLPSWGMCPSFQLLAPPDACSTLQDPVVLWHAPC